jgi:hypothetical protein
MTNPTLILELLNGPLDGHLVPLKEETIWGAQGEGPLIFPWDAELHERQARFFPEEGSWWLEGYPARHGTYCVNREERIEAKVRLQSEDILKASDIWLLVRHIG